jgi:hypothetical protein
MEEFGVPLQVEFGRIWSKFGRKIEFEKLIPNLVIWLTTVLASD